MHWLSRQFRARFQLRPGRGTLPPWATPTRAGSPRALLSAQDRCCCVHQARLGPGPGPLDLPTVPGGCAWPCPFPRTSSAPLPHEPGLHTRTRPVDLRASTVTSLRPGPLPRSRLTLTIPSRHHYCCDSMRLPTRLGQHAPIFAVYSARFHHRLGDPAPSPRMVCVRRGRGPARRRLGLYLPSSRVPIHHCLGASATGTGAGANRRRGPGPRPARHTPPRGPGVPLASTSLSTQSRGRTRPGLSRRELPAPPYSAGPGPTRGPGRLTAEPPGSRYSEPGPLPGLG